MTILHKRSDGAPYRIQLDDQTLWAHPEADDAGCANAYRVLLTHPWGVEVSVQKVRMLRRELRSAGGGR